MGMKVDSPVPAGEVEIPYHLTFGSQDLAMGVVLNRTAMVSLDSTGTQGRSAISASARIPSGIMERQAVRSFRDAAKIDRFELEVLPVAVAWRE